MANENEYVKVPKKMLLELLKLVETSELEDEIDRLRKEFTIRNNHNLEVGMRNLNDGMSLLNTMEMGLMKIKENTKSMLQLVELVLQDKNTFGDLELKLKDLKSRINEIAKNTSFNGIYLLNQEEEIKLQISSNVDDYMVIKTTNVELESCEIATKETKKELENYMERVENILFEIGGNKNRLDFTLDNLYESRKYK